MLDPLADRRLNSLERDLDGVRRRLDAMAPPARTALPADTPQLRFAQVASAGSGSGAGMSGSPATGATAVPIQFVDPKYTAVAGLQAVTNTVRLQAQSVALVAADVSIPQPGETVLVAGISGLWWIVARYGDCGTPVEGFTTSALPAPSSNAAPGSGTLAVYRGDGSNWAANNQVITLTNRDANLTLASGVYVVAMKINGEWRVVWASCTTPGSGSGGSGGGGGGGGSCGVAYWYWTDSGWVLYWGDRGTGPNFGIVTAPVGSGTLGQEQMTWNECPSSPTGSIGAMIVACTVSGALRWCSFIPLVGRVTGINFSTLVQATLFGASAWVYVYPSLASDPYGTPYASGTHYWIAAGDCYTSPPLCVDTTYASLFATWTWNGSTWGLANSCPAQCAAPNPPTWSGTASGQNAYTPCFA